MGDTPRPMSPTEAPGFKEMLAEMRSEKDERPRYLVPGWHELAIDRCRHLFRERASFVEQLFVVEGRVLRSTAPDFAGQKWSYVCDLKWRTAIPAMEQIAHVSANLEIARLANDAEQCAQFGLRKPDQTVDIEPAVVVLANTFEKRMRAAPDRTIFVTTFEACR